MTPSEKRGKKMSVLGTAAVVADLAKSGYELYQNDRAFNAQSDMADWNKKYSLAMAWQQQQNRAADIARSDRILAENRAREDSAWQRAVADIQKAGLSTTMLAGGASSGATATNVGSGASGGGNVHSGVSSGRVSGVDFGALLDMKRKEEEVNNLKDTNELIKAQKNYYNSLKKKTDADAKNTDVRTAGQLISNNQDALYLADSQYYASNGRDARTGQINNGVEKLKSGIPLFGGLLDYTVNNAVNFAGSKLMRRK